MKFYLLDDDSAILHTLKLIIINRNLGEICGTSTHPLDALEDFPHSMPDIVIVDLLMPEMDGVTFVKQSKALYPHMTFIMLSQVSSKNIISDAYESGIKFYLQKPINSIEVETVIKHVCEAVSMERTLYKMKTLFHDEMPLSSASDDMVKPKAYLPKLQKILQRLGILGDNGNKDIIVLVELLITEHIVMEDTTVHELCSRFSDSPKSMEQRIRRAANTGLINLAHLGLEDYGNDSFVEYSSTLYNFEQVRKEMDFIRGKSDKHGNVKVKTFLNSLVQLCQE